MRFALTVLILAACKGGDPTPTGPAAYTFKDASVPEAVTADLPAEAVDAWDAAVGLLGMADLIGTDTLVQELLGNASMPTPGCWTAFAVNSITIDLDYQACGQIGAQGAVTVARLAQAQAVAFQPSTFEYNQRRMSAGELVLTPNGNSRWLTSGAVWTDPLTPPSSSLTVTADGRSFDIDVQGRSRFLTLGNSFHHWGQMNVTGDSGTQAIWYGATTEAEATGDAEPDAVLEDNLLDECRCPTIGTWSIPTTLSVSQVDMDLNRSLDDGGTTWPTIPIETTANVSGVVQIRPGNQCGRLQGEFVADEGATLVLTGAEIQAGIDVACTANAFGDEEKCLQMKDAAAEISEHEVTLGERVNGEMTKEMIERLLDPDFCAL